MAKTTRQPVYIKQLPPTPCTPDMRVDLIELATRLNISIAEAQRRAISLFLSSDNSKPINNSIPDVKRVVTE